MAITHFFFLKDAASWLKYLSGTRDNIKGKLNQIQERVSIRSENSECSRLPNSHVRLIAVITQIHAPTKTHV